MRYFLESKLEKNIEIINKTNNNKIQADTLLEVLQTRFRSFLWLTQRKVYEFKLLFYI